MKNIKAGGYACMYLVQGNFTGRLIGCKVNTEEEHGDVGVEIPYVQLEAGVSSSTTEEKCCYEALDPYNMGLSRGTECINGAVARQC